MSRPNRYVVYQNNLYRLCGISFDKTLTDYTYHILEVEYAINLLEDYTIDVSSLTKAPMRECKELEGLELETARLLYEQYNEN